MRIYPALTPKQIKLNMQRKRFKNNLETEDNIEANRKMLWLLLFLVYIMNNFVIYVKIIH